MENSEHLQLTGQINSVTLKLCQTQYAFLSAKQASYSYNQKELNLEFEIPPQKKTNHISKVFMISSLPTLS